MESETRTEYRVVGERPGGERWEGSPRISDPAAMRRTADELARRNQNVRIQKRTVSETPWEDVTDE